MKEDRKKTTQERQRKDRGKTGHTTHCRIQVQLLKLDLKKVPNKVGLNRMLFTTKWSFS
jgi:hypothetical protein